MGALSRAGARDRALAGRVVGVYASGGAPWHHLALAAAHGADVRPVRAEDVAAGRLDELDAFVVPGGGATAMAGMLAPLGVDGARRIRTWVGAGGTYVSSCAGSVLPLALGDEAAALLPTARCLRMVDVAMANPGDATLGGLASPGVGRITVRLDREHPFTQGRAELIDLVHYNGPLFDVAAASTGVRPFAWPVAATPDFTPAERFLTGPHPVDADTTLARCLARGASTGLEAQVGAGRALLFGSHPEFGLGPLLLGWGEGAALLVAALASCRAPARRASVAEHPGWSVRSEEPDATPPALAERSSAELRRAAARFDALSMRDAGGWLAPDHAASFHGRDARRAWREDCSAAARVALAAAEALDALAGSLSERDRGWLDDAPRDDQDFGAMGLRQLLARIHGMLAGAERTADEPPQRPAHAYDLFDRHPFHLAVGSYLSAAGLTSAALLITQVLAARHGTSTPAAEELLWLPAGTGHDEGAA
ncbi:MAG: hypothetical protein EA416_02190 [Trueperaceae bacterium]|nr:MAG: hypothetical protein EA416_02190 [Trueperaceae bacterium]